MKILFLCTFYHRALLFRQQMDALTERGHYVRAFNSAQYGEKIADKFVPIMDDKVVHIECWNKVDRALFFPRQWKIERELVKAYDLNSFDIIHAHLLLSSGYSALRMKRKYGIPYVVSVRVTDLTGFIRFPYFRKMAVEILKEASGILFLSNSHKEELERRFLSRDEIKSIQGKCSIIGNCLEAFWTENRIETSKSKPDNFHPLKVLTVAKIKPIKNITVAADAVDELNRRGISARLTVVGENQDQAELVRITNHKCVDYIPFMKKEDLIELYASQDIFLLPSINETFGRVYLEAMTQGLPVLYTIGQGFDGYFADGKVGYAIPSDNPLVIADRIEDILKNYTKISESCINNSALFDETVIMDRLEQFYKESLNR